MLQRPAPRNWARGFVFFVALAPIAATGHDLWVLAGQYRLDAFETTRVFINNGDDFPESLSLLGEHRVTELALHGPAEKQIVDDFRVEGTSLSFEMTPATPGSHVLALATRARRVRLKAEDFDDYLRENGLERIIVMREELGESDQPAVERYAKWAKALIDVEAVDGDPDSEDPEPAWSEPVGHAIEIVPDENPNEVTAGGSFGVVVLFRGEPLAGASVTGGKAGGPAGEILTTTDSDGRATVTVLSSGRWYLRSIHMIRHDDDPEVRWESFWCTLTLEVR